MRLIDADALMELFDERLDRAHLQTVTRRTGKTLWSGIHGGINWGRNTIADAPTIDAVPVVHGRWKEVQEEQWLVGLVTIGYECSECAYGSGSDTDYCPNCGARMDDE